MNETDLNSILKDTDCQSEFKTTPVLPEQAGERLDKFLVQQIGQLSRNQFIRLIESDQVIETGRNQAVSEADYRVKTGDCFWVHLPDAVPAEPEPEVIKLDILYEDDDLLVVNKPAGLVVHPGAGNYNGTLVNALLAHCGDSLSGIGGVKRPGIVHRIDKDTSGILVVAKNDFTHVRLSEQFAAHTIERVYQAVVWGHVQRLSGVVSGNIGRSCTNRQKMAIVKVGGKSATTHYERVSVLGGGIATHIQCVLETGRTHQIRVHMASIGHSLVGDAVYGVVPKSAPEFAKFFPRQALHAGFLAFQHPKTLERLAFEVDMPSDMQQLLADFEALSV